MIDTVVVVEQDRHHIEVEGRKNETTDVILVSATECGLPQPSDKPLNRVCRGDKYMIPWKELTICAFYLVHEDRVGWWKFGFAFYDAER